MRSVKLCGAPALSFGCPDPCKIDRNQFKFDYNSNKMRSAAFAVEATLVFLASRIDEKMIKINSNSITIRIKCAQQPSRLKQNLVFLTFFGVQGLDKAFPFKWNTRVFIVFRRPGSRQSIPV